MMTTNEPSLVKTINMLPVPGISDLDILAVDSELGPEYTKKPQRKVFVYNKANWEKIKQETAVSNLCKNTRARVSKRTGKVSNPMYNS